MIQLVENKTVDGVAGCSPSRRKFFALALKLIQLTGSPGHGDWYIIFWDMADGTVSNCGLYRKI